MRTQLAFKANPAGRRMRVIQMRRLAVEASAPVFFLVSALGQRDMGRKIKRELTDMLLNVFGGRKKEQKAGPPPGTPARQIPGPFPTPPTSPFSSPMVPATAPPPSPLPSLAPLPSAGSSPSAAVGK